MPAETETEASPTRSYWRRVREAEILDPDEENRVTLRYDPALEGLRTILMFVVVLRHTGDLVHLPGGFKITGFGSLTMFFVVSGFLVTALLLRNLERTNTLLYKEYTIRRIQRLGAPALLYAIVYVLVNWRAGEPMIHTASSNTIPVIPTAISIITFTINLVPTFGFVQRYDSVHMWSLAVDMQIYLMLPLFLLLLFRLNRNLGFLLKVLVGVIVIVQVARYIEFYRIYDPATYGDDMTSVIHLGAVYQRPENNLDPFIMGVILCLLWKTRLLPMRLARWLWIPALVISVWCMGYVEIMSAEPYAWGYLVIISCSFILVTEILREGSLLRRALGVYPMRVVGRVSFTVYIWHFFVLLTVMRWVKWDLPDPLRVLLAWGALAVVSVVAWWIAERPLIRLPPVRSPVDRKT